MSALDSSIDDLYRQPLNEFTEARNKLAKSLSGADAKRVRALPKPALVPWAVNQVYWRARGTYDRLMTGGERLRAAQIAALEGRHADVRAATEAHRRAIADAVGEAERLAAAVGSKPGPDALARTFEALSVGINAPESPGRLSQPLQPAGFEALAGVKPQAGPAAAGRDGHSRGVHPPEAGRRGSPPGSPGRPEGGVGATAEAAGAHDPRRERQEARSRAAEKKRADLEQKKRDAREAAVKTAEASLVRAEAEERRARAAWERAHDEMLAVRRSVSNLKSGL